MTVVRMGLRSKILEEYTRRSWLEVEWRFSMKSVYWLSFQTVEMILRQLFSHNLSFDILNTNNKLVVFGGSLKKNSGEWGICVANELVKPLTIIMKMLVLMAWSST